VLGLGEVDEDELYTALDWLRERQPAIEATLAKRHLTHGTLVLYDVSSSYMEGRCCPLAKRGYSRDGRKGTLQIVYGLLCAPDGCPVAIEVFEGNTADPMTLASQVEKLKQRFQLDHPGLRVADTGNSYVAYSAQALCQFVSRSGGSSVSVVPSEMITIGLPGLPQSTMLMSGTGIGVPFAGGQAGSLSRAVRRKGSPGVTGAFLANGFLRQRRIEACHHSLLCQQVIQNMALESVKHRDQTDAQQWAAANVLVTLRADQPTILGAVERGSIEVIELSAIEWRAC
jgi:hypothetical protein